MKIKLETLQETRSVKELYSEMEKTKTVKELLNSFMEDRKNTCNTE
jgi:hypothetical protein